MNFITTMTKNDMAPSTISKGGVAPVFSYLDPLLSSCVQPTAAGFIHIIDRIQYFSPVVGLGNRGLKSVYTNVPVYHGMNPQDICLFYHLLTIIDSSSYWFLVHLLLF